MLHIYGVDLATNPLIKYPVTSGLDPEHWIIFWSPSYLYRPSSILGVSKRFKTMNGRLPQLILNAILKEI